MTQSTGAPSSNTSTPAPDPAALKAAQADLQAASDRFVNSGDRTSTERAQLVHDLRAKAAVVDAIERQQP
jgi:hypothetical protein